MKFFEISEDSVFIYYYYKDYDKLFIRLFSTKLLYLS